MNEEILEYLNKLIRAEHGNRVTIDSKWTDAEVDSFGTTMVFLDMDTKYVGHFSNDWFKNMTVDSWHNLTIKDIVERALDESVVLQSDLTE